MRYHNITKDDMLNGEGLRVVLWVAGCGHACPGCHNPVTWDAQGGDPLFPVNRDTVGALCREIRRRFPKKTIWLYTGYQWEEIENLPFLDAVDVVVDGRFVQERADPQLHWRGSANQRLIDVRRSLTQRVPALLKENT